MRIFDIFFSFNKILYSLIFGNFRHKNWNNDKRPTTAETSNKSRQIQMVNVCRQQQYDPAQLKWKTNESTWMSLFVLQFKIEIISKSKWIQVKKNATVFSCHESHQTILPVKAWRWKSSELFDWNDLWLANIVGWRGWRQDMASPPPKLLLMMIVDPILLEFHPWLKPKNLARPMHKPIHKPSQEHCLWLK